MRFDLREGDRQVLLYICRFYGEIGDELAFLSRDHTSPIKGCRSFKNSLGFHDGFDVIIDNIKFSFHREMRNDYLGDFNITYKDVHICRIKLISEDNHWNGKLSHIEVTDSYERSSDSRHSLKETVEYLFNFLKDNFYVPHIKKVSDQRLYADLMYDEFSALIKA